MFVFLGDLPIVDDEIKRASGEQQQDEQVRSSVTVQQLVTADGTYATQSAFSTTNTSTKKTLDEQRPVMRGFLYNGNFFIASALARCLVKLAYKYQQLVGDREKKKQNRFVAEAMFILASVLHYGKSGLPKKAINEDDCDSVNLCLRVLSERTQLTSSIFTHKSFEALTNMLNSKLSEEKDAKAFAVGKDI
jgi:coatomer subunit beta